MQTLISVNLSLWGVAFAFLAGNMLAHQNPATIPAAIIAIIFVLTGRQKCKH